MTLFAAPPIDGISVLALDTGQKLGWATLASDGDMRHGLERLPPNATGVKWRHLWGFLNRRLPLDFLYVERNFISRYQPAVIDHGRFLGICECWCQLNDVAYREAAPSTVKHHATGSGRSGKGRVMAFAHALGYTDVDDDNVADAIALRDFALADIARERMIARAS